MAEAAAGSPGAAEAQAAVVAAAVEAAVPATHDSTLEWERGPRTSLNPSATPGPTVSRSPLGVREAAVTPFPGDVSEMSPLCVGLQRPSVWLERQRYTRLASEGEMSTCGQPRRFDAHESIAGGSRAFVPALWPARGDHLRRGGLGRGCRLPNGERLRLHQYQYDKKVTICHRTGSKKHPFVTIRVSRRAVGRTWHTATRFGPCSRAKFAVCHKSRRGKDTMKVVGVRALHKHLRHGDRLGSCRKGHKGKKGSDRGKRRQPAAPERFSGRPRERGLPLAA